MYVFTLLAALRLISLNFPEQLHDTAYYVLILGKRNLFHVERKEDQKSFPGTPNALTLVLLVETKELMLIHTKKVASLRVGRTIKHRSHSSPHSCMNVKINFAFRSGRTWPETSLQFSGNRLFQNAKGGSHSFWITSVGKCRPLNFYIQNICPAEEIVISWINTQPVFASIQVNRNFPSGGKI